MGKKKIQYEEIKAFIEGPEGNGCKLLTTKEEYESNGMNTNSKYKIMCKCGKTFQARFDLFKGRNQRQCKECGISKRSESRKGKKLPEETRKKMSEAHKGKCVGENHPMYGKHQSEETKEKNRQAHLKENLSEETRIKMSIKAKQRTGLKNHRSKPVWCEELKEVRPSGKEWAKELKLVQSSVSQCCNGKRNHTGGYHFRFATKEEIEKYKKERGEK